MKDMDLSIVTSLADLEFKAKTNKYYRQLAVIVWKLYDNDDYTFYRGKQISNKDFQTAINYLHRFWLKCGLNNCHDICISLNENRCLVKPEETPKSKTILSKIVKKKTKKKINSQRMVYSEYTNTFYD